MNSSGWRAPRAEAHDQAWRQAQQTGIKGHTCAEIGTDEITTALSDNLSMLIYLAVATALLFGL